MGSIGIFYFLRVGGAIVFLATIGKCDVAAGTSVAHMFDKKSRVFPSGIANMAQALCPCMDFFVLVFLGLTSRSYKMSRGALRQSH